MNKKSKKFGSLTKTDESAGHHRDKPDFIWRKSLKPNGNQPNDGFLFRSLKQQVTRSELAFAGRNELCCSNPLFHANLIRRAVKPKTITRHQKVEPMRTLTAKTDAPWRVGLLFSETGVTSVIERTQLQASRLAIEEINAAGGINGRELRAIHYDPGSSEAGFAQQAMRLMTEDGVTTMFGCYTSSSRKAVLPIVERLNGLLWYPTLYEGFEYSPNIIYTGAAPNQNSIALSQYLIKTYGNRFFLIGSDYIYPRESNRVIGELVRAAGGSVVAERYVSLRAQRRDFLPLMRECMQRRPSVIFSTVVGEATTHLYQAYADAGFDPHDMPIASLTTTEAEIGAMGAGIGCGHITAAPYFEAIDSEVNQAFVRRYKQRFGADQTTNMCVEAAYFQVHVFARALAMTNSIETDCLRPMVMGSAFDAPQGQITINPSCGHTDLWTRLGRVNDQGRFDILWQSQVPVGADPYLVGQGMQYA